MLELLSQLLITWIVLGLIFLALSLKWAWTYAVYTKAREPRCVAPLPPGSVGWPLIGETVAFLFTSWNKTFYDSRLKRHGPVYVTHIFGKPVVRITGAELIREVMANEQKCLIPKTILGLPRLIGGSSILFSQGEQHKNMRKVYLNALGPNVLDDYARDLGKMMVEHFDELCKSRKVPLHHEIQRLTSKALCKVMLGLKVEDKQVEEMMGIGNEFLDGLFSVPLAIPGSKYEKALKSHQRLWDFFCKYQDLGSDGGNSVLSWILQAHSHGIHIDKGTVLRELILAGQVTIGAACTTLICLLHHHPDVRYKLQGIINEEFGSECDEDLSMKRVNSIEYLDWVVREVLRLHPPAGGFFRETTETIVVGGYQIPKGWSLNISIGDTQKLTNNLFSMDDNHQDLSMFRPERWDLQKEGSKHCPSYIPFGMGNRQCVGKWYSYLFIKVLAIRMLQVCDFKLLENDIKPLRFNYLPVHRPSGTLNTVFTRKRLIQV